jgi:hypothetical protein
VALPPGASAYDLGDLLPAPGIELVLLHADGVELLSLASPDAPRRRLRIEQAATFGAAEAEDGLERHRMVYAEFAAQPWILVPLLREVVALDKPLRAGALGSHRDGQRAPALPAIAPPGNR